MLPLLDVRHLTVEFPSRDEQATRAQTLTAVRDLSFVLAPGEVLGLVGESGSGKSVTSLALMRLLPPQAKVSGEIFLAETATSARNLIHLDSERIRRLRGTKMAMIFQEPMTALNPVMSVGAQIAEAVTAHEDIPAKEAWDRAIEAMNNVAIPDASRSAPWTPSRAGTLCNPWVLSNSASWQA